MSGLRFEEPSLVQQRVISTRAAPIGKELSYWESAVCDAGFHFNVKLVGYQHFHSEAIYRDVGKIRVGRSLIGPHIAAWNKSSIRRQSQELLSFHFVLSGSFLIEQNGDNAHFTEGMAYFHDMTLPFHSTCTSKDANFVALVLPRAMVEKSVKRFDCLSGKNLREVGHLSPLVLDYAQRLMSCTLGSNSQTHESVGNNLIDLVCTMLAEGCAHAPLDLSEHRTAALMRVKRFIEHHLSDPDLKPTTVAEALRISSRYINLLLQAEGTSLGRLIWQRRLERIAADLRNAALSGRSISTIALSHGFLDFSHLSKAFRQRYGMSPREYRQSGSMGSDHADAACVKNEPCASIAA